MSLKNCSISFNKPVFFAGEVISGKICLKLEKNKSCEALMLNVKGEAKCSWTESHGTGKYRRTIYYKGHEIYFKTFNNLMANQHVETKKSDMTAGEHFFDFAFVLPENLPSSIEGYFGRTRYTASVTLKRQYKFDLSYKVSFTVLNHVDINMYPHKCLPIHADTCKNFYLFFAKRGTMNMTVKIPFSGFVSGQYIPVNCHIVNNSKVKVQSVKAGLYMTVTYQATTPHNKFRFEKTKICKDTGEEIGKGEDKTYDLYLYVPPTPSTTLTYHSIITVEYDLKVEAVVSGMHGNLSCKIPVTIGTIPFTPNNQMFEEPQTSTVWVAPSAPPSYEEAMIEKRMAEDDEDGGNSEEYTPKYPVYHFEKIKEIE